MIKKLYKRTLALLLVLVICTSLGVTAAAQAGVTVPIASTSDYIYNTGTRGTVATALSENALAFYRENGTSYAALSAYAGGTGVSDAPSSALYNALQTLMRDAHDTVTSYNGTKSLFQYTDCEGGGGVISSFYSGAPIGPSWDGGWNREHTWPDSKGLGGDDENDIMMLRPTASSENGARGNTAYGESSGYYNPNTASGGRYDLRGD
ncbi:MAG: hypothetical protein J6J66_03965, partial [Clostridia bacterium]|nr:hypothetical protein [Clostridia bacterium]